MDIKEIECVSVEISVYKPTGFTVNFLVKNIHNRILAIKYCIDYMNKNNNKCMECVNYIIAKPSSSKNINKNTIIINNEKE